MEEIAAVNKGDTEVTTVDKIAQLHDVFEFTLGPDEWAALANLSETEIKWLYDKGIDYAIDVMSKGVAQEELENAREKIIQSVRNDSYITGAEEKFLLAIDCCNLFQTVKRVRNTCNRNAVKFL